MVSSPSVLRNVLGHVQIYERSEQFRQQIGNLDLIVNIYNGLQHSLHPVEKPLVQLKLDAVDTALEKGLGVSTTFLSLLLQPFL